MVVLDVDVDVVVVVGLSVVVGKVAGVVGAVLPLGGGEGGGVQPPPDPPVPWRRVLDEWVVVVVVARRRVVEVLVVADLTDAVGAGVVTDTCNTRLVPGEATCTGLSSLPLAPQITNAAIAAATSSPTPATANARPRPGASSSNGGSSSKSPTGAAIGATVVAAATAVVGAATPARMPRTRWASMAPNTSAASSRRPLVRPWSSASNAVQRGHDATCESVEGAALDCSPSAKRARSADRPLHSAGQSVPALRRSA